MFKLKAETALLPARQTAAGAEAAAEAEQKDTRVAATAARQQHERQQVAESGLSQQRLKQRYHDPVCAQQRERGGDPTVCARFGSLLGATRLRAGRVVRQALKRLV
jgi:hypothetical protein